LEIELTTFQEKLSLPIFSKSDMSIRVGAMNYLNDVILRYVHGLAITVQASQHNEYVTRREHFFMTQSFFRRGRDTRIGRAHQAG
jgi:hypothetical protein